jgi:glycosyltransferase involved in cell wall biosynthesis
MPGPVIYLVRSWPTLSQTFILNEVLALERRGVELLVISMVRSADEVVQPQVSDVRARVSYLDQQRGWRHQASAHCAVLSHAPLRYARTLRFARRNPQLSTGYATSSTMGCFRNAVQVAATVIRLDRGGSRPRALHAHFAHDPALVALLVRRLTGLPYSFTAHARDLVQIPVASLIARSIESTAIVTCCAANADYIESTVPAECRAPVRVIRHGVDLDVFRPDAGGAQSMPGCVTPGLVSVGRLVEKKGYSDLLRALSGLKRSGHVFECRIYGDGPARSTLVALRDRLDLSAEVEFAGERGRDEIIKRLHDAGLFLLTPILARNGDRDGIPNVLVEAMACGLPVVTTSVGGITELVEHGVNGLLTDPGDVADIERQVARLLQDPQLRRDLGVAARRTVESRYDVDAAAREMEAVFRTSPLTMETP